VWSDGTVVDMGTGQRVTDEEAIAFERARAIEAEAEDAALGDGLSERRVRCALRIDFLVALTFALDLWEWTTREVVVFLAKASTEEWRCRFSDHPVARKFAGRAQALMSHSWGNKWGTLIVAAAQGAPMGRYIWICALANRQWAGNAADIDFASIVERCDAVIVANPVPKGRLSQELLNVATVRDAYLASEEGKAALSKLTTSRIWCIGKDSPQTRTNTYTYTHWTLRSVTASSASTINLLSSFPFP